MTPDEYRSLRECLGTLNEAAAVLGVNRVTINQRELGNAPIDREAALAIEHAVTCRGCR